MAAQSTLLPIDQCGLEVRVDSDGVWLSFKTENGMVASLEVGSTIADEQNGDFIRSAINQWWGERRAQAKSVAAK